MQVFGIDFTSAPKRAKPITWSSCRLVGQALEVEALGGWESFDGFDAFLRRPGEWMAAVDFPLGQPRRLIEALRWPTNWADCVKLVGTMTKPEFVETITAYCQKQPTGEKHHLRETDRETRSCSPMMLYGVPVGRMFFEGAPRVMQSGVSVLPCRPNNSGRVIVEGYPALVARRVIGKTSYKNDNKAKGALLASNRRHIVETYECANNPLGIQLLIPGKLRRPLIDQASADQLDAVLCALQLAAARLKDAGRFGIPPDADPLEGWIVDPAFT